MAGPVFGRVNAEGLEEGRVTTPEGKVKNMVKDLLADYDIQPAAKAGTFLVAAGWYYMPVQGASFGVKGIPDFIGQYRGMFWAIETKAPKKKPTGFQQLQINTIRCSGGAVFVVDGEESLTKFEGWLLGR